MTATKKRQNCDAMTATKKQQNYNAMTATKKQQNYNGVGRLLVGFLMGISVERIMTTVFPSKTNEDPPLLQTSLSPAGKNDDSITLWWMSNLFRTPLQMTEPDSSRSISRQLVFPPETKTVWVDVGILHKSAFIPDLNNDDSLFVIGFEPSVVAYKPCEHKHCAIFWAACTPDYDVVTLNVQTLPDCNSLLKPNTDNTLKFFESAFWKGCITQEENKATGNETVMQVPGIPLYSLLERIPSHITVEFIKIDAQGYDLEVLKGALRAPHGSVKVVALEAMDVENESELLYKGQPRLQEMKEYLEERGWIFCNKTVNNADIGEVNAFFASKQEFVSIAHHLSQIHPI